MPGSPVWPFSIRSFAASPLFFDTGFPSGRSESPKTDGVFPSSQPSFGARLLEIFGERGSRFPDCLKPFFLLHRAAGSSGFLSHPGSPPCAFSELIISRRKYIQTKIHSVQILYPDHGVYADGGSSALLGSRDQIDSDMIFGICPYRPQPTSNASNLPNTAFCKNAPRCFQTAQEICADWMII